MKDYEVHPESNHSPLHVKAIVVAALLLSCSICWHSAGQFVELIGASSSYFEIHRNENQQIAKTGLSGAGISIASLAFIHRYIQKIPSHVLAIYGCFLAPAVLLLTLFGLG